MFTKIGKILLWIGLICGIIVSIAVGSSMLGSHDKSIEALGGAIIPVGIIMSFVSFTFLGMLVEISENIRESCDHLRDIKNNAGKVSSTPQPSTSVSTSADKRDALSRLSAIANDKPAEDFWYCKECGTTNDKLANTCKGCGKYK